MTKTSKQHLISFNRNSYLSLLTYLLAVSVTIYFSVNEHEQLIRSISKLSCFAVYLGFMTWSLVNLKNYFEATRKDDYSIDILIYAIIGIPLYLFAFFYIRAKLKKDLSDL